MATSILERERTKSLKDRECIDALRGLRRTDNTTNLYYIARTWLFLVCVIGGTIWFYHYRAAAELSAWWNVPVTLAAIVLVGAGQHQLTGLAHEASHHILFRHRLLNDLVSDWLFMFPMFSTTHHYRLQHLAHHQFVNDPDRDPDVSQLRTSGHWLRFPLGKSEFLKTLAKQLWVPNLIKYIRIRAKYNSMGTDKNPYLPRNYRPAKVPVLVGIVYLAGLVLLLTALVAIGNLGVLAAVPAIWYASAMAFYATIPASMYHHSRVRPVISSRAMTLMRITFLTLLFNGLAWLTLLVDPWTPVYYLLLWAVPIFTSFSFFMVLRQLVQHGNGDRGWLSNTRIFFVNRAINFAVFPIGQDYHLPHHMFASIPHYRLKDLHERLLEYPEYRERAVIVDGYFLPHRPPRGPTVLDLVGPEHSAKKSDEVYIDNSVLEDDEVVDKDEIVREANKSSTKRR